MIKMQGRKMVFTGKEATLIKKHAKEVGMKVDHFVIGVLWEQIMRKAREGVFLKGAK